MKIEKRGESYRFRKMFDGKMYSITLDYKPSQKEALSMIMEMVKKDKLPLPRQTFKSMADKYLEAKSNILSPSTIKNYKSIYRNISPEFMETRKSDITAVLVQEEINQYAANHSSKSVRNYHGFISAVLKMYHPGLVLNTTLPQVQKVNTYIPGEYEIEKIMTAAKDTRYEIPLYLALCGLRRSEIFALTIDDLNDDNILTINKALVLDEKGHKVLKSTKTTSSTRQIVLPEHVADLIRDKGYIIEKGMPIESINKWLSFKQEQLHLHHFKLHSLRHYFASVLSKNGVQEADIMYLGGWSTPHVMKAVYRHTMLDKDMQAKKEAMEGIFKQRKKTAPPSSPFSKSHNF